MEVETLQLFCDLVETKSFTKAASLRHITQSAVSQKIRQLEDLYGTRLFTRSNKQVATTTAGEQFYKEAQSIVVNFLLLNQKMKEGAGRVSGHVTAETIYSVGFYELQKVVKRFLRRYPEAEFRLGYQQAATIYKHVEDRKVDLGIVAYPETRTQINVVPLYQDRLVLVYHPQHRFRNRNLRSLSCLSGERFIAFHRDTPTGQAIGRILSTRRIRYQVVHEFDNVELIKRAVEIDDGVALLPLETVRREIAVKSMAWKRFSTDDLIRPIGVIYKKGHPLSEAALRFVCCLKLCSKIAVCTQNCFAQESAEIASLT